jgi:hypothetical protein
MFSVKQSGIIRVAAGFLPSFIINWRSYLFFLLFKTKPAVGSQRSVYFDDLEPHVARLCLFQGAKHTDLCEPTASFVLNNKKKR